MMPRLLAVLVAATASLLAACASPGSLQPGQDKARVGQLMGRASAHFEPDAIAPERWQYRWGREVWNLDFDSNGQLLRAEQALAEARFAQRIQPGTWRQADVMHEYGRPAHIMQTANFDGSIWVFPYLNGPIWRLLYIDIDPQGVVRGYALGDEYRHDFPDN